MGHITRPLGTSPVDPAEGARKLAELQARPGRAHAAEGPGDRARGVPDRLHHLRRDGVPDAARLARDVRPRAGRADDGRDRRDMRATGAHQGLSPVLDVVRDYRWGRVEETFGEDPYLVGMMGSAYVRGPRVDRPGRDAEALRRLQRVAGRAQPRAGSMGPRTLRDVMLLPFEMAIREGGARSVMNSYTEIDGLPVAADASLLTGVLRDEWGFEGTVVSDYWSIVFLLNMHRVAATPAEAGALSLAAGIDVELPHTRCYGEPLAEAVRAGDGAGGAGRPRRAARAAPEGRARPARPGLDVDRARRAARHRPARASARSPASSPTARSCCWPTTGRCRCAPGRSRSSGRAPPTRCRSSAATRTRTTA